MPRLSRLIIAACIVVAPATAIAADQFDMSAPVASSSFDWNGFYAGVYGVTQSSSLGGAQAGIGVNLGAEARFEFVLVGAEVAVHFLDGGAGNGAYAQVLGRAGVVATDNLVLYGAGGLGLDLGAAGGTNTLLGAGVELALTETMSVRGQYVHGFDMVGTNPSDQVSIGANFHF